MIVVVGEHNLAVKGDGEQFFDVETIIPVNQNRIFVVILPDDKYDKMTNYFQIVFNLILPNLKLVNEMTILNSNNI